MMAFPGVCQGAVAAELANKGKVWMGKDKTEEC